MSMRRYEVVFVLAPQQTEDEVKSHIETFSAVAEEKGAKVLQVDEWGKRRLAFPVKKHKEGIYVILTLEEENADAVSELERRFRVAEPVIRYLTVRVDEDLKRAEKFGQRRQQRKSKRGQATPAAAEPARVEDEAAQADEPEAEKPAKKSKPAAKEKSEKAAKKDEAEAEDENVKAAPEADSTPDPEQDEEETPAAAVESKEDAESDEEAEDKATVEEK